MRFSRYGVGCNSYISFNGSSYDHLLECDDSVHALFVYQLTARENCMSTGEHRMKTLNQALRTILLALAFIGTATTATAYSLVKDGIYYNINGNEATVTYISFSSNYGEGYNYYTKYSGHVTIPDFVTYNGLSYMVTGIGSNAFENCNTLTSVTIPNTVTVIGNRAFYKCSSLINVSIPNSVTAIGSSAFEDCFNLTSISIPNSVTAINNSTFQNCINLSSVYIGNSVSSIENYAFRYCPLTYITCLAEIPPTVPTNYLVFSSFVNTTLYVPAASIEAYQTASVWNNFKIITDFKPNYLSLDDVIVLHGDTIVVPVMMENQNDITAFQTDIYLVEGFEVVKDGNDYMVELSDRKGRDHVIMTSDAPDGAVRVVSYSPTLKTFSGNDCPLFYITIKAPQDGDGIYPIIVKNTRLTTADDEEVLSPDAYCNMTVLPFIMGDVNGSGDITVADIVLTAKYILYQNPEPFIFGAADLNGDERITITDVVKIAHMVLDADYDEPTQKMNAPVNGDNMMSGEMDNNTHSVAISLNNDQDYTAFQLDLTLPDGMTASDFTLTERANDLCLNVKDRGNGKIRLMGYALDLKTIKGSEGDLLTFNVAGEGAILVDGIQLVTPEGLTTRPNGFVIAKENATSVNEIASAKAIDHVDYYNLTGQRVDRPENGVTLIVTTYTDGTRTTTKVIK